MIKSLYVWLAKGNGNHESLLEPKLPRPLRMFIRELQLLRTGILNCKNITFDQMASVHKFPAVKTGLQGEFGAGY
jgi:hypothetical protein